MSDSLSANTLTPYEKVYKEFVGEAWFTMFQDLFMDSRMRMLEGVMKSQKSNLRNDLILPAKNALKVFKETRRDKLSCVIVGDMPYVNLNSQGRHTDINYNGRAFAINKEVEIHRVPKEVTNILMEIETSLHAGEFRLYDNTRLDGWGSSGILLLNSSPTTFTRNLNGHRKLWKFFIEEVISRISMECEDISFLLMGEHARKLKSKIFMDNKGHLVKETMYPKSDSFVGSGVFVDVPAFQNHLKLI